MDRMKIVSPFARPLAIMRHTLAIAAAGLLGLLLGGSVISVTPAAAGDIKLESPCDALETTDVTKVDNGSCRAISAIYIGEDGKPLYFERLELDGKRLVSGRLVRITKTCVEGDADCGNGCKAGCTICLGGRCGCAC